MGTLWPYRAHTVAGKFESFGIFLGGRPDRIGRHYGPARLRGDRLSQDLHLHKAS